MRNNPISNDTNFYKVMLGKGNQYASECLNGGFVGVGWFADTPLNVDENYRHNRRDFNNQWAPIYLLKNPEKSKVSAGLACGSTYTVCFEMKIGDVVIAHLGNGSYSLGVVETDYRFVRESPLPHQRGISWFPKKISRDQFSQQLRNSMGSIGTVVNLEGYNEELMNILAEDRVTTPILTVTDSDVQDPSVFALEQHLEDFLVQNWENTELSKNYEIYRDEDNIGKQFPTDTGRIDILAITKDKKELLVIELKRGRVSDVVVGQIQRYMGYVKDVLAEEEQTVKGLIIGLDDDVRIKRALSVTTNIEYFRYEVLFKLIKTY